MNRKTKTIIIGAGAGAFLAVASTLAYFAFLSPLAQCERSYNACIDSHAGSLEDIPLCSDEVQRSGFGRFLGDKLRKETGVALVHYYPDTPECARYRIAHSKYDRNR